MLPRYRLWKRCPNSGEPDYTGKSKLKNHMDSRLPSSQSKKERLHSCIEFTNLQKGSNGRVLW